MGRLLDEDIVIDVIDNLDYMPGELVDRGLSLCKDAIKSIPSAQSEIVRCKDCVHFSFCQRYGCKEDDFCSYSERRTDGER